MTQQTAAVVAHARTEQARLEQVHAENRSALDEVLGALMQVAEQRDDALLAMTVEALRQVHDLYDGYSLAAQSSTTGVQARRDIHATLSRAFRQAQMDAT
jgi:hypothetical protein